MRASADQPIIGKSPKFQNVLRKVTTVAPTDCTVLILGETGTGKEVVAQSIHNQSARRSGPFVRVNCAAIPAGLLESELFGHERGAFTGAIAQTTGRFQLADGGTFFLDEIGDLPLELQPKLLRVLQEHEFERLGSAQTVRTDVRIIAATNQDLEQMVAERKFRADLFYRLSVFPLSIPPLKERREDIRDLLMHFVAKYAQRMKKQIDEVPEEVVEVLRAYDWPGNIRELQNFVERAVLMTNGRMLYASLDELKTLAARSKATPGTPSQDNVLARAERSHILDALRSSGWIIGGQNGAAARTGLRRTTFIYRMNKYGITRKAADQDWAAGAEPAEAEEPSYVS
jgi:formate hydrogenlyase transcriptional activator